MTNTVKVAVIGASGYTGGELLRLLSLHPNIVITKVVASEKSEGRSIADILPNLSKAMDFRLSALDSSEISQEADVIFLALPHTQSLQPVSEFVSLGKTVIDLSADYRLKNPKTYEQWYDTPHTFPKLLPQAVYGLPEFHRKDIAATKLVAVPGCYPTVAILQLAPLITQGLLEMDTIIIDAKSGVSGAGRSPALGSHFPEANEGLHAYKLTTHRHTPEITQELSFLAPPQHQWGPHEIPLIFTPHLIPMNRGILSTAYAKVKPGITQTNIMEAVKQIYGDEYFIRLHSTPDTVNPNNLRGSNFCDLGYQLDPSTRCLITTGAIDNLVKGAAGQAIQCMNIMSQFPENTGLTGPGVFP
ncbi:MAG: N-acetyl-gamma-glutamyl-phosphate reductase [Nitrospirales bacterium]|nr:N-acetyl-gamma-glutamyl-phosphate reductase [Nitrospirales bacterium]